MASAQQKKFKTAATACKPTLYAHSAPGKGPSKSDWKAYGSCMRKKLKKGRK